MRRPQLSLLLGSFTTAFLLCLSSAQPEADVVTDADPYVSAFEKFIKDFGKTYTEAERPARFAAFKSNYDIIQSRNAENHSYKLGITAFADLTAEEFSASYGGLKPHKNALGATMGLPFLGEEPVRNLSLPGSVDWRKQGAVSSVKSQGQCGACWAFAGAAAIEGSWKIATGTLVSLSVQQIIDCSAAQMQTGGCKGSSVEAAIQYSHTSKLTNDAGYPYKAAVGTCRDVDSLVMIPKGGVVGYKLVKEMDEQALMEAVAQQPVAVGIEADQTIFQLYKGGVLTDDNCGSRIDHAILVVGYGTDRGQDYWLIKNSWGEQWGESGFGRLARGKPKGGECGIIATAPVVAVVDGSKLQPINIKPTLIAAGVAVGIMSVAALGCYIRSRMRSRRAREAPLLAPPAGAGPRVAPQTAASAPAAAPAAAAPTLPRSGGQRLGGTKGTQAGGSRLVQQQDTEASGV